MSPEAGGPRPPDSERIPPYEELGVHDVHPETLAAMEELKRRDEAIRAAAKLDRGFAANRAHNAEHDPVNAAGKAEVLRALREARGGVLNDHERYLMEVQAAAENKRRIEAARRAVAAEEAAERATDQGDEPGWPGARNTPDDILAWLRERQGREDAR